MKTMKTTTSKTTNIESIKEMAKTFLYLEPNVIPEMPFLVQHPFFDYRLMMLPDKQGIDIIDEPEKFNELRKKYEEQIDNADLIKQLYQKISNKGYTTIKDYLYYIYIKNLKEIHILENIDKINDILINEPDLFNFKKSIIYDRFISYTCYLFKEIVNYSNGIIDTIKLKRDCHNYINIINNKIKLYNER